MLFDNLPLLSTWFTLALPALLLLLSRYVAPTVDENEPPLLKPRIPFIGHIVSMFRDGSNLYVNLL